MKFIAILAVSAIGASSLMVEHTKSKMYGPCFNPDDC